LQSAEASCESSLIGHRMKQPTDEFISEEIRYLDPELNCDPEFETIRTRGQHCGTVIKVLLWIVYLSFALDLAALGFVYGYL